MKATLKPYPERYNYTILSLKDFSHCNVKRYSANVLLCKEHTQQDITEIVKIITQQLKTFNSQVICLFLYLSTEDFGFKNWICQTQWISKTNPPSFSFLTLDGNYIDDEIIVNYKTNYEELKAIFR
ncbi:hypothetical protein [Chamaesiphon polymorphus]|nr:hypothetical protein [Chamaesiphon polymorphus]